MAQLSEEQKAAIQGALKGAGATAPCPRCGCTGPTALDGYIIEHTQAQLRNIVISGNNRLACAATVCRNCGFIAQHALDILGVATA